MPEPVAIIGEQVLLRLYAMVKEGMITMEHVMIVAYRHKTILPGASAPASPA